MSKRKRRSEPTTKLPSGPQKEPWPEQIASFVGFFIYLLILKSFFLPLFIIPTGSMAQTLFGEHTVHTCPNCGVEYPIGWNVPGKAGQPRAIQCPNCRWQQFDQTQVRLRPMDSDDEDAPSEYLPRALRSSAGDRIFVHGWPFAEPFTAIPELGPQRWDVVVFRVPTDGETNYIKRLVGLPGEKIELIDGDLFVNDRLERKTRDAQRALWFPYYDHDYRPRAVSRRANYHPRWDVIERLDAWSEPDARTIRFSDDSGQPGRIQFATNPYQPGQPGRIQDVYSYNFTGHQMPQYNDVTDVRLSADVEFSRLDEGGYFELTIVRNGHHFHARITPDGLIRLQQRAADDMTRQTWAECSVTVEDGPVHVALSHIDGTVVVELGGRTVLESTEAQYRITPQVARQHSQIQKSPALQITAANAAFTLQHLLIERDVYYTTNIQNGYGVKDHPLMLAEGQYYLLGDNSPSSQDARYAFTSAKQDRYAVGPHLVNRPDFAKGTVPADQLIGRAFFVYWPGFMPLSPKGPNFLPDLGRARWIR